MALFRGLFVRKDATRGTTPVEARKALAALLAPAGPAAPRAGILAGGNIVGTASWTYSLTPLYAVLSRGASDGAVVAGNDGTMTVATIPAPASGSRIDIVWMRHGDVDAGDPTSDIEVGVANGDASGSPIEPSIPAGALELARATVGSGATNTSHANVTIEQSGARTALRGVPVPVRNKDERDAYVAALTATGRPPSALHPVQVLRADAAPGGALEYTIDGTTWSRDSATVTYRTGWTTQGGALTTHRSAGMGLLTGRVARTAGSSVIVGDIKTGFQPSVETFASVASKNSGNADGPRFEVILGTSGTITVTPLSGGPAWGTGTWLPFNIGYPL